MQNRLFRFRSRIRSLENGGLALLVIAILLLLIGGMVFNRSVLMKMLRVDAGSTSTNWVATLVGRNREISLMLSGVTPSNRTRERLDEASRVGDVYRFRIWDKSGQLVFTSERVRSAHSPAAITQQRVAESVLSGSMFNEVHAGSQPEDPPFFVESFIPVKENGSVIGVFEVFLDQTDDKALYEASLRLTETVVALLILLAGGLPGYMFYRKMLDHRVAQAEAQFLAEHDSLTGLANRTRMRTAITSALSAARRNKTSVAVLIINLDRFREINDSLGAVTGDQVLQSVAMRLRAALPEEDLAARMGGDEFAVLQVGMVQPRGASFLAHRLIEILSEPHAAGEAPLNCGASIGVAIAPPDADEWDTLIGCARAALRKAKREAGNTICFFEPGMDAVLRERRRVEMELRRALETDSLQLAYQPLVSLHDLDLVGFEALLRWPEGWPQPQSPGVFIPVAEESGLIHSLGAWALHTACKTAANWTRPLKIAVNVSPVQFHHGDIVALVEQALAVSGLDPARLELEVTESLWIQDNDAVLEQLRGLRNLGVSLALDDFGTGYSSMTRLWKFPFDTVKIDRSFVNDMESEEKAAVIVNSIISLGRTLGLTITAEGVQTSAQAERLAAAGCDQAQGFWFSRPLSAPAANALADADQAPNLPLPGIDVSQSLLVLNR